ncbi:cilia- and flagella-associated protein 299 isoform X1 [Oncorhynchus keta]|uniref:cilia- and flagella-associated protein 299 isoform X1 n=1 Tax=Oncorhynchus keta TaxID=8018 RepID=UPI00227B0F8A|nr:cilia- and flagella-associated protein 299 isoform X1 [Oncorhynchus keta]
MEEDNAAAALDNIVTEFHTYEDFLDSQITSLDLYYLEDEELARQLVELGYRGSGEVLKREEFETRKAAAEASRLSKRSQQNTNSVWLSTVLAGPPWSRAEVSLLGEGRFNDPLYWKDGCEQVLALTRSEEQGSSTLETYPPVDCCSNPSCN